MKKELDYFHIGTSFGGNQDWFRDPWMHIGGCAAAAACDSCIQLEFSGMKQGLCPFDVKDLDRDTYVKFAMKMKPYLRPRWSGIDRLDIFTDGFGQYLKDTVSQNKILQMTGYSSDNALEEAAEKLKYQIDNGFPVPFLLLRHKDIQFKDLLWHWFMLVGYEQFEDQMFVKIATYGTYGYRSFSDLWNSGYENNGGMIIYKHMFV